MATSIAGSSSNAENDQGPIQPGVTVPVELGQGTNPPPDQLGPNFENLETQRPELVSHLRDLVMRYRMEGLVARRQEIRRDRLARLYWQGLQYAWWDPGSFNWNLPFQSRYDDDTNLEQQPRYQFVTNYYLGFGLTFVSLLSQDVPTVRFYPQSAQNIQDIYAAKAASDVAELIEQNNNPNQLLRQIAYHFWCDGKVGGYVRFVADGEKFGFKDEPVLEAVEQRVGDDPEALTASVPKITGTQKIPNGQEVITIVGGLELNTPVWAHEQTEFPYLQWQTEVHRSKLRAVYPHVADKIQAGEPQDAEDVYARVSRLASSQGLPQIHPADALYAVCTFTRTWLRPAAFMEIEDKKIRTELMETFPEGCYVAFAGTTYCEARNESMDKHWRVKFALPGDGSARPGVGDPLVQIQERYNTLSNIQAETYEYGIPPIYADPDTLDFEALQNQTAEPGAHYPARAKPGQSLANSFFQPAPGQVTADMIKHMQDLIGPVAQFVTGLFPAIFGGEMEDVKTASGYAMARDQAMGRIGLVFRTLKEFWAEVYFLAVMCFKENRAEDVEIPVLGDDGEFDSKWIRVADLQGNIMAYPEPDETFPRLKSQQRAILQAMMGSEDPLVMKILSEPANMGTIKGMLGLTDIVVPGEDSRNKQLREIDLLLKSAPLQRPKIDPASGAPIGTEDVSSVPVDQLLDDHAVEFEECKRWANSEQGQQMKRDNSAGFANVHAHAQEHYALMQQQIAQEAAAQNVKMAQGKQ